MRVISRRKLREFWQVEPDSQIPLLTWLQVARRADWKKFADVREIDSHADLVGKYTVFNVGRNKFRLVTHIHFNRSRIYIHCVLNHKDYDAGKRKSR